MTGTVSRGRAVVSLPCERWTGCRRHRRSPAPHPRATSPPPSGRRRTAIAATEDHGHPRRPRAPSGGSPTTPPRSRDGPSPRGWRGSCSWGPWPSWWPSASSFASWPRSHMWLDEALTLNISRLPLGQIHGALRRDGAPPLYYYLLHFWSGAFGSSDAAVRALSGVLSCATLPVHLAGRASSGRQDGGGRSPRPRGDIALRGALRHREPHVRAGRVPHRGRARGPAAGLPPAHRRQRRWRWGSSPDCSSTPTTGRSISWG